MLNVQLYLLCRPGGPPLPVWCVLAGLSGPEDMNSLKHFTHLVLIQSCSDAYLMFLISVVS